MWNVTLLHYFRVHYLLDSFCPSCNCPVFGLDLSGLESWHQWRTQDFILGISGRYKLYQIIYLPGWQLVAIAVLSLWGTKHDNDDGINPFPLYRGRTVESIGFKNLGFSLKK